MQLVAHSRHSRANDSAASSVDNWEENEEDSKEEFCWDEDDGVSEVPDVLLLSYCCSAGWCSSIWSNSRDTFLSSINALRRQLAAQTVPVRQPSLARYRARSKRVIRPGAAVAVMVRGKDKLRNDNRRDAMFDIMFM